MAGVLTLCGTPIGNLEDASERLIRTLKEADCIACEDPRRTKKLLTHFRVRAKDIVVYNEGNERRQSVKLVGRLKRGDDVALVSDAGMPGMSDPGYRLVMACVDEGIDVTVVPGPNAAVSALGVSGRITDGCQEQGHGDQPLLTVDQQGWPSRFVRPFG